MGRVRKTNKKAEDRMVATIDALNEFDDFRQKILPEIRQMLFAGKPAAEIYKHFKDKMAARKVSIALNPSTPEAVSLTAMKDIEDRLDGKAVERRENTHKYEQLPDEQLNSLLLAKMSAANAADTDPASSPDPDQEH